MIRDAAVLRQQLIDHAPQSTSEIAQTQYTGSGRLHYGVPQPIKHQIVKAWAAANKDRVSFGHWGAILDALYQSDSVDERILAGMLLAHFKAYRERLPLHTLERWLGQLEGWVEVDSTCQSSYSEKEMLTNWEAWQAFLRQINKDDNINKRRASLVLLVKPIRGTDPRIPELALELVDSLKHERDKLITKAVSWVLREGVKNHREMIAAYIETNKTDLPALVVREVTRKLETGRK
jgi:3-methyladenine DNA glycosylase AlkD